MFGTPRVVQTASDQGQFVRARQAIGATTSADLVVTRRVIVFSLAMDFVS